MRQLKITQSITNRESPSLEKYLQDIGKEEMVTPQEEVELARRIKQGDHLALDKLTRANLRFVVSVAKQYQNQGMTLSDLINEGNLGLIKAAQRFDETKGFKFISYAVWWIRQSILQAIAEQSRMVRLPLNQIGAINKVKKVLVRLEQQFGREPSAEEIAEVVDLSYNQVKDVLTINHRPVSMDAPFDNNDENNSLLDVLANEEIPTTDSSLLDESLTNDINRSLSILSKREAEVIRMFYGIGTKISLSLDEIAIELQLTRERVRQIKESGLRKLKHSTRNKLLKSYL
ncbi:MAG: RNA polymerase sigma factor RpoD/SigA [Sphingobacteriales bacterium]|nr:RNA polymerase sigma factor RpoD/SigA [Sphingobacteriales bacterium]